MLQKGQISFFPLRLTEVLGYMAAKWQGRDQTRWTFFCIIISPASLLGACDAQPGYRGGWRRTVDKTQIMAILSNWPTSKKTGVSSKWHCLFWFWDLASYKCAGLPRTGKGRRKKEKEWTLQHNLQATAFLTSKKKVSQVWRNGSGGGWGKEHHWWQVFSQEKGITPLELWKMNHVFSIKTSHRFSGKLVIEDTIETTVLFGSVAFSGGNCVNHSGD